MGLLSVSGVQIDIGANLNPLRQGLAQAESEINRLGRNVSSGGVGFGGVDSGIKKSSYSLKDFNQQLVFAQANALLIYKTFSGLISTVDQLAQQGFAVQKSFMALDKLAGSSQEAQKWITAIQDAMLGTVTSSEAATQAFTLMKFHLADSADSAGEFARDIAIVAASNPQLGGTANALSQIQLTLANTSYMRLDQLGLSAADVKKRVDELKAATKGLSTEQAFQQAVMEGLHDEANLLGDDFLAVGNNTDRLKTKMRELKDQMAVTTSEGVEGLATALMDLGTIWDHLLENPVVTLKVIAEQAILNPLFPENKPNQTSGNYMGTGWSQAQVMGYTGMDTRNMPNIWNPLGLQAAKQEGWMAGYELAMEQIAREQGGYFKQIFGVPQARARGGGGGGGQGAIMYPNTGKPTGYFINAQGEWEYQTGTPSTNEPARGIRGAPTSLLYPGMAGYEQAQNTRNAPGWMGPIYDVMGGGPGQRGMMQDVYQAVDNARSGSVELANVWAHDITGAVQTVIGSLSDGLTTTSGMVDNARSVASEFERMKNMSLDQVLGIDASRLATDVYGEMKDAMKEAGVEEDVAAEAMRKYELQTGLATAASEVFDGRMSSLADELAAGRMTVDQYIGTVEKLATTDFSWIDDIFGGLSNTAGIDAAMRFLDRVSSMNPENMQGTGAFLQDPFAAMADVSGFAGTPAPPGAGGKGASAAMGRAPDFAEMLQNVNDLVYLFQKENVLNVDTTEAQQQVDQFEGILTGVLSQEYTVGVKIVPTNTELTIQLNIPGTESGRGTTGGTGQGGGVISSGPSTHGGAPEFALGGEIPGSGPQDIIAHGGEYVVPQGGALVMRGGGSNVNISLLMDSRVAFEANYREANRRQRVTEHVSGRRL